MTDRTCNLLNCNRPRAGRGMCNLHYQRALAGRPLDPDPKPTHERCTIEACDKLPRSKHATMCAKHYHRVYRYGTVSPKHPPRYTDLTGSQQGELTVTRRGDRGWICDCACGATILVLTGDWNRGQQTCGNRTIHFRAELVGYSAAHDRMRSDQGPANHHSCTDCDAPAYHWSYNHTAGQDELTSEDGFPYSLDPEDYSPRCVPCHKRYDLAILNLTA